MEQRKQYSKEFKEEAVRMALQMVLRLRQPTAGLLHHSHRGSQYACNAYQKTLTDHKICCSMS